MAQPGELPADECVEDLFSGGDGWKHDHASSPDTPAGMTPLIQQESSEEERRFREASGIGGSGNGGERGGGMGYGRDGYHKRSQSGNSTVSSGASTLRNSTIESTGSSSGGGGNGRGKRGIVSAGTNGQGNHGRGNGVGSPNSEMGLGINGLGMGIGIGEMGDERGRTGYKRAKEVDEFVVRDDLVAWGVPEEAV